MVREQLTTLVIFGEQMTALVVSAMDKHQEVSQCTKFRKLMRFEFQLVNGKAFVVFLSHSLCYVLYSTIALHFPQIGVVVEMLECDGSAANKAKSALNTVQHHNIVLEILQVVVHRDYICLNINEITWEEALPFTYSISTPSSFGR